MTVILRCERSEPRRTTARAVPLALLLRLLGRASFEARLRRAPQDDGTEACPPQRAFFNPARSATIIAIANNGAPSASPHRTARERDMPIRRLLGAALLAA